MPDTSKLDMQYRPALYWDFSDLEKMVQATVKGTVRRETAMNDMLRWTDQLCLEESLPEAERDLRGSIHPIFMSGEYLPDLRRGEVEIARVTYASATGDVVAIRARWEPGRIRYRAVDEYMEDGPIRCPIKSSTDPLTFQDMVRVIDESNRLDDSLIHTLDMNHEGIGDAESLRGFITVTSPFYPEIEEWYEAVFEEWLLSVAQSEDDYDDGEGA
jgi:hypothetical protein